MNIKTCYKARVTGTMDYSSNITEWNPEKSQTILKLLIYVKGGISNWWRKKKLYK